MLSTSFRFQNLNFKLQSQFKLFLGSAGGVSESGTNSSPAIAGMHMFLPLLHKPVENFQCWE
jgi:hypothetical protein